MDELELDMCELAFILRQLSKLKVHECKDDNEAVFIWQLYRKMNRVYRERLENGE